MHEILGGLNRQTIHHFQSCRDNPRADDIAYRGAGVSNLIKCGEYHLRRFRSGNQLHGDFHDHAKQSFGAVH